MDNHGEKQAWSKLETIRGMLDRVDNAEEHSEEYDKAIEAIQEYPLEVSVRSGWTGVNEEMRPDSFMILLCTGGPAVRITGRLDEFGTPDRAQIEYQDWYEPWTRLKGLTKDEEEALITYASEFYYAD